MKSRGAAEGPELMPGGSTVGTTVLMLTLLIVGGSLALTLGLGYFATLERMEDETVASLELLVRSRAEGESQQFEQAERNVASLKRELLRRIDLLDPEQARARFHQLFELQQDGIWRVREEFNDFTMLPTLYLHQTSLDASIHTRAVASYDLLRERGPAVVPPFYSIYMDFVEKGLMVYSPSLDWGRSATSDTDNFNYPTMTGSDPAANPEREKFWTPVYLDAEAGIWMVSVVEPLDIDGRWVGTVGHDVAIEELLEATLNEQMEGTYNIIVSQDGQLIAHPEFTQRIEAARGNLALDNLGDPFLDMVMRQINGHEADFGVLEDLQGRYLLGLGTVAGPDWKLVTVYPRSLIVDRAVNAMVMPTLVGTLILICALVLANLLFMRKIVRPLQLIDKAVTELTLRNSPIDLTLNSDDEFGRLAQSFNTMSESLKLREQSLVAARKDWERTFDTVPEMICIMDSNRVIQRCNRNFCQRQGYQQWQLVGVDRLSLLTKDLHARYLEKLELAESSKAPLSFVELLSSPDGEFEIALAPLLDEKRGLLGIVEVCRDITENRRLEAQLLQSQKMEAIGHLAGGVAHDFNNLLQVVIGYCEILMLKHQDGEDEELNHILEAAMHASSLTTQLLTFSRQQELDAEPVDLNDIVNSTCTMVRRLIEEHIELECRPSSEALIVNASRIQIEQVLLNLCVNARDAMPGGGRLLVSSCEVELRGDEAASLGLESAGNHACIEVSDTGIGMSKETQAHIFEPFFTTKDKNKGTGLGLATAYGIVNQHAGAIVVSSQPGQGSSFTVYFPLHDYVDSGVETAKDSEAGASSGCILVAEDNDVNRTLIENILESGGFRVISARDGLEACELYRQHAAEIDLLLFDVIMPRMNGRVAAEEIHKLAPDLPCLFASGYSEDSLQDGFLLKEGVHLIKKPFRRIELLSRIQVMLDGAVKNR